VAALNILDLVRILAADSCDNRQGSDHGDSGRGGRSHGVTSSDGVTAIARLRTTAARDLSLA
jgi:hypothetical protein